MKMIIEENDQFLCCGSDLQIARSSMSVVTEACDYTLRVQVNTSVFWSGQIRICLGGDWN